MDKSFQPITYPWAEPPGEGEAIEVAEGVLWLRLPLPMTLDHVNIYALDDGDGWTLIDTGMNTRKTRAIWERLLAGPLKGKPVSRIVMTHHHPDHVGLVGWFMKEHGARLEATRVAWLLARMLTLDVEPLPTAEAVAFRQSAGVSPEYLERFKTERPFNFADTVAPIPVGFLRLKEGEQIRMGGRDWDIRLGNGHAPEHATFWSRDDNLVISGDQIIASISPNLGVYVQQPEENPLADWLEACTRLAPFAREDHLVLAGHKLPFTGLPLRMHQLIENHEHALERLMAWLVEPKVAVECFPPLFKRKIDEGTFGLATVEAIAHLNYLYQKGDITRERRDDGAWVYQAKGEGWSWIIVSKQRLKLLNRRPCRVPMPATPTPKRRLRASRCLPLFQRNLSLKKARRSGPMSG